jgi:hypothetical protein
MTLTTPDSSLQSTSSLQYRLGNALGIAIGMLLKPSTIDNKAMAQVEAPFKEWCDLIVQQTMTEPAFHSAPYGEVSTHIPDPQQFVNELYRRLLDDRPYFPGDTTVTGHCIDSLMERLESMGATRAFDDD